MEQNATVAVAFCRVIFRFLKNWKISVQAGFFNSLSLFIKFNHLMIDIAGKALATWFSAYRVCPRQEFRVQIPYGSKKCFMFAIGRGDQRGNLWCLFGTV